MAPVGCLSHPHPFGFCPVVLTRKGLRHTDAAVRTKALDNLRRVGVENLRLKTLAELNVGDASPKIRSQAGKVLSERMDHLSTRDLPDVRELMEMFDKPEAVTIGLEAVEHLGLKAKEVLPDLLKRLPAAEEKQKLPIALALAALDAKNFKVAEAISPILIADLRPKTKEDKPNERILKAVAAVGWPIVGTIFKALEASDDIGLLNANHRKALYVALQRIGRAGYSNGNLYFLRKYRARERYRDVQEAAGKAMQAMLSPRNDPEEPVKDRPTDLFGNAIPSDLFGNEIASKKGRKKG